MMGKASFLAIVHGRVQGVYFRAFVQGQARELGLTGYVRNLAGGTSVEVRAEGEKEKLEKLVGYLHIGPEGSRVENVDVEWSAFEGVCEEFKVRF